MKNVSRFLLAGAALVLLSGTANASLIPTLCGSPGVVGACGATPGVVFAGGAFTYTYNINLAGDQRLDRSGSSPFPTTSQFLTIYDIPGLLSPGPSVSGMLVGTIPAPGTATQAFTVTTPATGLTPMQPACCTPPDTGIANILINLNGGVGPISGGVGTGGQDFLLTFRSSFNVSETPILFFAAQAINAGNSSLVANTGLVVGPTTVIPEPTTMLLLGGGLIAMATLRRRFVR